jgi:hypothetical protein
MRVRDAGELATAWARLIDRPDERAALAAAASRVMERHRGALRRTVDHVMGAIA